jgi:hypothetical protein
VNLGLHRNLSNEPPADDRVRDDLSIRGQAIGCRTIKSILDKNDLLHGAVRSRSMIEPRMSVQVSSIGTHIGLSRPRKEVVDSLFDERMVDMNHRSILFK